MLTPPPISPPPRLSAESIASALSWSPDEQRERLEAEDAEIEESTVVTPALMRIAAVAGLGGTHVACSPSLRPLTLPPRRPLVVSAVSLACRSRYSRSRPLSQRLRHRSRFWRSTRHPRRPRRLPAHDVPRGDARVERAAGRARRITTSWEECGSLWSKACHPRGGRALHAGR